MTYLDLDLIKKQCVVSEDFHDDDSYLSFLGDMAEELIAAEIDSSLTDAVAANGGEIPKPLLSAMLMVVDFNYSAQRGSNESDIEIPAPVKHFCALYRQYN